MSKLKRVDFDLHQEDIRRIITTLLDQIIERKKRKRVPIITIIGEELSKEDPDLDVITDGLAKLTDTSANEAIQMQALLPLIASLKEDSPPETEVLEDSLDLKKYSL
jgi:hypothetical protein